MVRELGALHFRSATLEERPARAGLEVTKENLFQLILEDIMLGDECAQTDLR